MAGDVKLYGLLDDVPHKAAEASWSSQRAYKVVFRAFKPHDDLIKA